MQDEIRLMLYYTMGKVGVGLGDAVGRPGTSALLRQGTVCFILTASTPIFKPRPKNPPATTFFARYTGRLHHTERALPANGEPIARHRRLRHLSATEHQRLPLC